MSTATTHTPDLAHRLRAQLNPATQLEELFFDTILRLTTCAHYLARNIESDPELSNPETTRRMRLLLTTEAKLRHAYEEFRRIQLAAELQRTFEHLAAQPILVVVATQTTRSGLARRPRERQTSAPPNPAPEPLAPPSPALNAPCPCGSGLKFKRCCRNKIAA